LEQSQTSTFGCSRYLVPTEAAHSLLLTMLDSPIISDTASSVAHVSKGSVRGLGFRVGCDEGVRPHGSDLIQIRRIRKKKKKNSSSNIGEARSCMRRDLDCKAVFKLIYIIRIRFLFAQTMSV
ncbi:hypothetical protein AVEN_74689-1, partial [Araneus ventricosus]